MGLGVGAAARESGERRDLHRSPGKGQCRYSEGRSLGVLTWSVGEGVGGEWSDTCWLGWTQVCAPSPEPSCEQGASLQGLWGQWGGDQEVDR